MDMGQGLIGTTQELNVNRGSLPAGVAHVQDFFLQGLGRSQPCDGIAQWPCPCQLVLLMHCTQQEGHGTGLPGLLGVRCNTNKTRRFNQQPSYGVECMSNTNSRH